MSRKHDLPDTRNLPENEPSELPNADDSSDEANARRLRVQSEAVSQHVSAGQQTNTTPDSASGETAPTKSVGELDAQTPQERLGGLRGWAKQVRLGGPRQADWETFDHLVGPEEPAPADLPFEGVDRRP